MSKILVLGVGPLPIDVMQTKLYAPGLRTWHLAQVLAKRGHRIALGVIEFGKLQDLQDEGVIAEVRSIEDGLVIYRLRFSQTGVPAALSGLHQAARFDAIVSTTDIMNYFAALIPDRIPCWFDFNGDPFAEKQLQAAAHNSDAALLEQWRYLAPALLSGDRFSTCSTPQRSALIGQLGLCGRLNQDTAGEELVHVLLPCSTAVRDMPARSRVTLRGRVLPNDAFIVLWTGGYNTWTDPELLFRALETAIQACPRIYFVSTGGAIEGHDQVTFQRFRSLVNASEIASHFHFAGWVPTEQIPSYYSQADLALNVDAWSYECELGYRNRITEWIQHGCPVATTTVCEFARNLEDRELVFGFDVSNPQSLADVILQAVSDPELRTDRARRAREYFEAEMQDRILYGPMLDWAAKPVFARDRARLFNQTQVPASASPLPEPPSAAMPDQVSALAVHQAELLERLRSRAWVRGEPDSVPLLRRTAGRLMRMFRRGINRAREKL